MRGMQSLKDAGRGAFKGMAHFDGEHHLSLSRANGPWSFQTDLAAEMFAIRSANLGMSQEFALQKIERSSVMIDQFIGYCETPIEKFLLPWLVFADYGPSILTAPAKIHYLKDNDAPPDCDIFICPQFDFATYRLDFAIFYKRGNSTQVVCVECDGSEFHDRSNDNKRDMTLARYGVPTVRVTGREIHASPILAASRVANAVLYGIGG